MPSSQQLADLDRRAVDAITLARRTRAASECQFAVYVKNVCRARTLVERVDVLRDHDDVELRLERRDGQVCGIGLRCPCLRAPLVVELEHERGILAPALGTGEVLPGVLAPQSGRIAKGWQATLGGKAGAREDDYLAAHAGTQWTVSHHVTQNAAINNSRPGARRQK